jgi:hypothetical protein
MQTRDRAYAVEGQLQPVNFEARTDGIMELAANESVVRGWREAGVVSSKGRVGAATERGKVSRRDMLKATDELYRAVGATR